MQVSIILKIENSMEKRRAYLNFCFKFSLPLLSPELLLPEGSEKQLSPKTFQQTHRAILPRICDSASFYCVHRNGFFGRN